MPWSVERAVLCRAHMIVGAAAIILAFRSSSIEAQTGQGDVSGLIVDASGTAIVGVRVSLPNGSAAAVTDERGHFRLAHVPEGTAMIAARRLGFSPFDTSLSIGAGTRPGIRIVMTALPIALPMVQVNEHHTASDERLAGFYARIGKRGGHFITREQIDRRITYRLGDLLSEVPGVRILTARGGPRVVAFRGAGSGCSPLFFIDGFPATAGAFDVDMIDASSLEGVEIYPSLSSVPPELLGPRSLDRCGVVALWTRPAPRHRRAEQLDARQIARLVEDRQVLTASEVDVAAKPTEEIPLPQYPDSLWKAGIGGRVVLELVVDTLGRVEPGTISVVSASNRGFVAPARTVTEEVTFTPARRQNRAVRQLVQIPFVFEPRRDTVVTKSTPNLR